MASPDASVAVDHGGAALQATAADSGLGYRLCRLLVGGGEHGRVYVQRAPRGGGVFFFFGVCVRVRARVVG